MSVNNETTESRPALALFFIIYDLFLALSNSKLL